MPISAEETAIIQIARRENGGFHLGTQWFFRGWEPMGLQYAWHHAPQMSTTLLAGIAAGKTTVATASMGIDCLTIPYFRALSTSVTASQAELTFAMFMGWVDENPRLEAMIDDIVLRPYPKVTFKIKSEWTWRTSGLDAKYIRGFEYDRILFDEAGLDPTGASLKVLRGRLRGVRADNTKRMARLDVITSPTGVPWLRERFERGERTSPTYDPQRYFSMRVRTYDNTKLPPEQIAAIEADYPPEMIDVELNAQFPDYGYSMFPASHIYECVDQSLYDAVLRAVRELGTAGYVLQEDPRHGIMRFEIPADPIGVYVMAGDPGMDNPPRRNSGVIGVYRIDQGRNQLVYFHWVAGRGSYTPFLQSYKYAIQKYRPYLKGLDATGTQRAIDELAFENHGIAVNGINFGREKNGMLNALSLDITEHRIAMPPIHGAINQLGTYSHETDDKYPQDIVMMLAMLSYLARFVPATMEAGEATRAFRSRAQRTGTTRRRR